MKTARSIAASPAMSRKFEKKLLTFVNSFRRRVINEILLYIDQENLLAEDVSLTFRPDDPIDRERLRQIKRKINRLVLRDPERFKRNIDEFIARNMMSWLREADKETQKIADWYVRNLSADISVSQKASLTAAGIPAAVLWQAMRNSRKSFFITPQAIDELPKLVTDTVSLITRINSSDIGNIRAAFLDAYEGKNTYSHIVETLEATKGFTEKRARRVAIDQTSKISQKILQKNCEGIGIKRGVWIHVPGQYSSRPTHIGMNGKTFNLAEGLYDKAVDKKVMPGELYWCRCTFRPVIED